LLALLERLDNINSQADANLKTADFMWMAAAAAARGRFAPSASICNIGFLGGMSLSYARDGA
jgi:hypothetical protein